MSRNINEIKFKSLYLIGISFAYYVNYLYLHIEAYLFINIRHFCQDLI